MSDIIKGEVLSVFDYNSIDILISHVGSYTQGHYSKKERVYISETDDSVIGNKVNRLIKKHDTEGLEKVLSGKKVRCEIIARDTFKRLIVKLKILK